MTNSLRAATVPAAVVVILLATAPACTLSGALEFGPSEPLPQPTRVSSQPLAASLTAVEAGTRLEVRFGSEAERPVGEAALALAREAVAYVAHLVNHPVGGSALLLVAPAAPSAVGKNLRASSNVVLPVEYEPDRPLEEQPATWKWLETLVHELWHGIEPRGVHHDRWLGDGLPQWVAASFLAQRAPEFLKELKPKPPPVALHEHSPPTPWPPASLSWLVRVQRLGRRDPAAAAYLVGREVQRYRAAEALVDRWIKAMAEAGSKNPLADLLRELARHRRVDFPTANAICLRLTGRSLAQLAAFSPAEKADLARRGWAAAHSGEGLNVVQGLEIMAAFGVPPGKDLRHLIAALAADPAAPHACPAAFQLSRVVAAWGDEAAMTAVFTAYAAEHAAAEQKCALAPAFWLRWAQRDVPTAATHLAAILINPEVLLVWHEEANRALERLTQGSTGWRVYAGPARRAAAAARWQEVIAALPPQTPDPGNSHRSP